MIYKKFIKIILLLAILSFLSMASIKAAEEIIITDADSVWSVDLVSADPDVVDSTDVLPENLFTYAFVSHADSVWHSDLTAPLPDVIDSTDAGNLMTWAFVSHADSVWHSESISASDDVVDSTDTPPERLIKDAFVSHADYVWGVGAEEGDWNEPDGLDPVILVPGILGSWEVGGEWRIDPIFRTYNNLINAMEDSGYVLDEDFFTFPYDWRQSNVITADLLKQKIDDVKNATDSAKVDIVAHSMGGLVTRYYVQNNNYENDVDQVVFLGTPHQGSPKSYLNYEGAYFIGNYARIMKFTFQIEAAWNGYLSLPKYIRENVLSVEELLPVYDYLQEKINNQWQFRTYPNQYPVNTFLEIVNNDQGIINLKNRVEVSNIISSAGENSTLNSIKIVADPDTGDNKWMDGYPENLDNNTDALIAGNGDGTVPADSLNSLSNVNIIQIADTAHREIVTKAQQDVIEILTGERPTDYFSGFWDSIHRIIFIRVHSPVDFVVIAPDGKMIGKDFTNNTDINEIDGAFYSGFDTDAEFVTILNPIDGDYQVQLQGTDNGTYELGIDILEENNNFEELEENLISGIISTNEIEIFDFNYNEEDPKIIIEKEISFEAVIEDVEQLYQNNEIKKKSVAKKLKKKLKKLEKKYNQIEQKKEKKQEKIIKKIKSSLVKIKKKIKHYLKKNWITQTAYNILIDDINSLINFLN